MSIEEKIESVKAKGFLNCGLFKKNGKAKIMAFYVTENREEVVIEITTAHGAEYTKTVKTSAIDSFLRNFVDPEVQEIVSAPQIQQAPPTQDLRGLKQVLFETLAGVRNDNIDPAQAKAIVSVAQTILNAMKLEAPNGKIHRIG